MDKVKALLTNFPEAFAHASIEKGDDVEIRRYVAELSVLDTLAAVPAKGTSFLELLDPATNSAGYLVLLNAIVNSDLTRLDYMPQLQDAIVGFVSAFKPAQVRYVGRAFKELLAGLVHKRVFSPHITIEILTTAILRLDPTASTFTSTHMLLMKHAAQTQSYLPALDIANRSILYFPVAASSRHNMLGAMGDTSKRDFFLGDASLSPPVFITSGNGFTDKITCAMILEYNYLRGLIFISQRDWKSAQTALEQVISHPSRDRGVSKIMVEAHQTWILVGLLSEGSTPVTPSYTSTHAKTSFQGLNAAYTEFAKAFSQNNTTELKSLYEKHKSLWEEHKNLSLVEEVMKSYQQWQILQLRKAYSNITLSQVWRSTQNAYTGNQLSNEGDVAELIQSMIANGALQAKLETGDDGVTYVSFEERAVVQTEAEYAHEIARCHRNVKQLTAQYKFIGEQLASNDEYVKFVAREQKRADKDGPDPGVGFDSQIEDEDLMTGIVAHG